MRFLQRLVFGDPNPRFILIHRQPYSLLRPVVAAENEGWEGRRAA
jgi:hypothetical protein